MIIKIKRIIQGMSVIMGDILGGIARGMIYGNAVISNGGGVIITKALQ